MGFAQYNDYGPYKMISYEGEFEGDLKNGYGEMVLDNGAVFNGQWQNGIQSYGSFEGMGHKYMGYWKGKLMDIKGIYKAPDGKVYKGEIQNGKFIGVGEFVDKDQIIKGKFEDNMNLSEKGRIITEEMEYEGQIRNGIPHGTGTKHWLDSGEVYSGQWENGVMYGEGKLKMQDLSVYSGGFEFGKFNGEGQILYADNSLVKGAFKKGVISGKGVFKYKTHDQDLREEYVGQFLNGIPHGVGTLTFVNGTLYNGEFKGGMMSGQGKLAIASEKTEVSNNECYIGQFDENKYDGRICLQQVTVNI